MARNTARNTVIGIDDLSAELQKLAKLASREEQLEVLTAGGELIAEEARRLAPRRSGDLANSISVREATRKVGADLPAVVIGPKLGRKGVFYAHFVEFGTRRMAARPYMRPAVDAKRAQAVAEIGRLLSRKIESRIK